jgi:hypothetical protein
MDQVFLFIGNLWNDLMRFIGAYGLISENPYQVGVGFIITAIISAIYGKDDKNKSSSTQKKRTK